MLVLIKKKLIGIIMLILYILAFYYPTFAIVSPTSQFYVNDYANVLTSETEQYIMNSNIELNNKTKAQIVVVTVNKLDGITIEEYATKLFREFGIGDKDKNNGVLLLCSTGERMFRIEVGYGLEGTLTDGKTGRIQDEYIIPYLKSNNYDEGIKNGFNAVLEEVCTEYGINISGAEQAKKVGNEINDKTNTLTSVMIISLIASVIIKGIAENKNKKTANIIKLLYIIILSIVSYLMLKIIAFVIIILMFNLIFIFGKRGRGGFYGGGFHGGGSSGGGFSGGRGSSGGGGSTRSF